jgi:predicted ester cyclase
MIGEGDRVAVHMITRATHRGELQGIAPPGKRVQVWAMDMFRIADGNNVDHWGHGDVTGDILRAPQRL